MTNRKDAEARALDSAQAIMDQSFYRIWPADAKRNIAAGLIAYASEAQREAIERAAKVAPLDAAMCQEIVAWWDTGILPGNLLRDHADAMLADGKADEMNAVGQAERDVIGRVIRVVAALADPVKGEGR